MKRQIISWGMMLAAAFTLTNCAKEIDNPNDQPESNGYPFEIVASAVDTKTANDGMSTVWVDGDKINLFHAEKGSADYKNDNAFTVSDVEAGTFNGELSEALTAQEYDWYALYPYSSYIKTPGDKTSGYTFIGYSDGLNQAGYNSMSSLKGSVCPLYGIAKAVPAAVTPVIEMKHLSSVVAINVTNNTDEQLIVEYASLTATEDIVGSYFVDVTSQSISYIPNISKSTATVKVSSGATSLAKGESAILYLAIKPFTAAEDSELVLSVNGYEKRLTLTKDVEFLPGKIKTLNFNYDATEVVVPTVPTLTVSEFKALEDGADVYELTGRISSIYEDFNATYNNIAFYLEDATGSVLIYRVSCADVDDPASTITLGDEVTVQGSKTTYGSAAQMAQGGKIVSHKAGCAAPAIEVDNNVVSIEYSEEGTVYYTINGDEPTISSTPYTEPFVINNTTTVKAIAVSDGKLQSLVSSKECEWVDSNVSAKATLTFDDKSKRTSYSTSQQVWKENNITLTNNKASSTSNVGDYFKPARFYKSSEIIVSAASNILKVEFTCNSEEYAKALNASITGSTVDGKVVTVVYDGTSTTTSAYTMSAQVRVDAVTVTYSLSGGDIPEQPTLLSRNLEFSTSTASVTIGQAFNPPTLSGVTVGVTYTSSNTSVAEVDNTGSIVVKSAGTTIIKATAPETSEYEADEAQYTLTVNPAQDGGNEGDIITATLTFDDKSKRTVYSTEQQVWIENNITLTNNKASSTSNIGDYSNPVRFYKSSDVIIEVSGYITQLKFDCTDLEAKYVTPLCPEGAINENGIITINLDGSQKSYTFSTLSAQARVKGLTVTYKN